MTVEDIFRRIKRKDLGSYIVTPKGSRDVQQFVKHGTEEQRKSMVKALGEVDVVELIKKGNCGMFTVERVVHYGLKADSRLTCSLLLSGLITSRKSVELLLFHRIGAKFLNRLFLSERIREPMKKSLVSIIAASREAELLGTLNEEKTLGHIMEVTRKFVDKELLHLPLMQKVLRRFQKDAAKVSAEFASKVDGELLSLAEDGLSHLLSSRDGVEVFVALFARASAKQRKNVVKAMKGQFQAYAKNPADCVALLQILASTDDTALLSQTIFKELLVDAKTLCELLNDRFGRLPLLFVLDSLQFTNRRLYTSGDLDLLLKNPPTTSKKDLSIRAKELRDIVCPVVCEHARAILNLSMLNNTFGSESFVYCVRTLFESDAIGALVSGVSRSFTDLEKAEPVSVTAGIACLKLEGAGQFVAEAILLSLSRLSAADVVLSKWSFILHRIMCNEALSAEVRNLASSLAKTGLAATANALNEQPEMHGAKLLKEGLAKATKVPALEEAKKAFFSSAAERIAASEAFNAAASARDDAKASSMDLFEQEDGDVQMSDELVADESDE